MVTWEYDFQTEGGHREDGSQTEGSRGEEGLVDAWICTLMFFGLFKNNITSPLLSKYMYIIWMWILVQQEVLTLSIISNAYAFGIGPDPNLLINTCVGQ